VFNLPQEAVNKRKIKLIVSAANYFMEEYNKNQEVRFDIISVLPDENKNLMIEHIIDAFEAFDKTDYAEYTLGNNIQRCRIRFKELSFKNCSFLLPFPCFRFADKFLFGHHPKKIQSFIAQQKYYNWFVKLYIPVIFIVNIVFSLKIDYFVECILH
jgi:hypothetical protein